MNGGNMINIQEKIKKHIAFWQKEKVDRPMIGFQIGTEFFADRYKAAQKIMVPGKEVRPEDIDVDQFLDDYERLYQQSTKVEQDSFWTACPFISIPWFEAILGCKIVALKSTMSSQPYLKDLEDLSEVHIHTPWFNKYLEFIERLVLLSRGRFPVGQPIIRGLSDIMGALRGQAEFVLDFFDDPGDAQILLERIKNSLILVLEEQQKRLAEFHGGYSVSLFDLWAPGTNFYIQEDLSNLLNPDLFRRYFLKLDQTICENPNFNYCTFHIHAPSFFILDDLMKIDKIKALEITKDEGGASIEEMLPQLKKILAKKRLILWGPLDRQDLDIILENLSYDGLYIHILTESIDQAGQLMDVVKRKT
jgi:hypothetical protein